VKTKNLAFVSRTISQWSCLRDFSCLSKELHHDCLDLLVVVSAMMVDIPVTLGVMSFVLFLFPLFYNSC
jgi:hypothetical protein